MPDLSVGEVARRSGVAVSALHFYERKGLIRSHRTNGNQRRFARDVLRRVAIIRAALQLGIPLAEVGGLLAALPAGQVPSRGDWRSIGLTWRSSLDKRIAALQKLRDDLDGCIGCGCLSMEHCALFNPQDTLAAEGPGAVLLERSELKPVEG
ncbi:redox-sensitive transcriptional activator SoxR [Rhizobium paknamense]|uniref:MerR family redox-sensitive transcriptional activator SoxR n=1 Tax=Rhizobium paknamense TaxID=1206817 RepID=A0ABU0IA32_9HYPH|nr:redox-sensitive transcriptional activator SoxR [Rhizobium paknamense]MDQ0455080.1 MerR family redox-sensitive transcriptional activator SoxR [Rhizobium paknamense]